MNRVRSDMDSDIEADNFPSIVVLDNIRSLQDHHYSRHRVVESNELRITSSNELTPPRFEIESSSNRNEEAKSETVRDEISETPSEAAHQEITERENSLQTIIDEEGDTPIHTAVICKYSSSKIIQMWNFLLDIFPDFDILNHANDKGQTPLHLAVLTNCHDTVQLLVDLEANPKLQDNRLRTAAHIACETGDSKSLELLCQSEVAQPADLLGIYDSQGQTCLHIAVLNGNIELVKILLDHEADINVPDRKSGRTALHFAAEAGDIGMIIFLLRYRHPNGNLKVNVRTFANKTPGQLAYGRRETRPDVVELLRRQSILDDDDDDEDDNDKDSDKEN